jgi:hypothetical protein
MNATKIKDRKTINYIDENGMVCSVEIDPGITGVFQRVFFRLGTFYMKHRNIFRLLAIVAFYTACFLTGYAIGYALGTLALWLWLNNPLAYWIVLGLMGYLLYRLLLVTMYS